MTQDPFGDLWEGIDAETEDDIIGRQEAAWEMELEREREAWLENRGTDEWLREQEEMYR